MLRLDQVLVERGLCDSREKAKRAIMAGQVRVNGQLAHKASNTVREGDTVELLAREKYVSRGGLKLEHALIQFGVDVSGRTAIDLGASTGGFTDCLLQRGAARVYAVDVGQGQLAWKLRQNPRVVTMEKTNARNLTTADFPQPFSAVDVVVVDCSFISLRKILPAAAALVRVGGQIVALVKPQFEAGKAEADRGAGVIRDPAVHNRVLRELEEWVRGGGPDPSFDLGKTGGLSDARGAAPWGHSGLPGNPGPGSGLHGISGLVWRGVVESPILGPAGNREFLALIEKVR